MTYHLTPRATHQHPKPTYKGLHLGIVRISVSQRFGTRFGGVRRVRLSYDTGERIICLMPSQTQKGPAGPDIYRISRDARGRSFIYCSTLHVVMPASRYQFVEQTLAGYLCRYDPEKPAGKREGITTWLQEKKASGGMLEALLCLDGHDEQESAGQKKPRRPIPGRHRSSCGGWYTKSGHITLVHEQLAQTCSICTFRSSSV